MPRITRAPREADERGWGGDFPPQANFRSETRAEAAAAIRYSGHPRFVALDALAETDGAAYERALNQLSEKELNAYLATR